MRNWYYNLNKNQKLFVYALALAGPWAFALPTKSLVLLAVLYIPLTIMIYLQLGTKE